MKINQLTVYKIDLPYVDEAYKWGDGYVITVAESYILKIDTDEGLVGWGECCPIGGSYLPAHPDGIPGGIKALAPYLLGLDPTNSGLIEATMDRWLLGHQYVKTAIDIACWDLKGKAHGVPCHALLGGRRVERMPMYRVLPQGSLEEMREQLARHRETGYLHFQVKTGGPNPEHDAARLQAIVPDLRPGEKIFADANRGYRRDQALKLAMMTEGLFYFMEQPCTGYHDCLAVRRAISQPVKLDESIQSIDDMLRVITDDACDEVCVKLDRFGGLTKSRLIRDLCAARGIPMTVESSWGGEIITTAHAHLATSTPPEVLMNTTDLNNYNTVHFADDGAQVVDGHLTIGDEPGLGVTPDEKMFGEPVAVFSS